MQDLGEHKLKQHSAAEQQRELHVMGLLEECQSSAITILPSLLPQLQRCSVPTGGIKVSHTLTFATLLHPFLPPSWRAPVRQRRAGTTDSGGLYSNISACLQSHLLLLLTSIGGKYGIT